MQRTLPLLHYVLLLNPKSELTNKLHDAIESMFMKITATKQSSLIGFGTALM